MKSTITGIDIQRTDFIENLYKKIKKQTAAAIAKHDQLCKLAASYMGDGCSEEECAELLIMDANITREAAIAYINMAHAEETTTSDGLQAYSFKFEDSSGNIWSSYDIGKTVYASNHNEASEKAEEIILSETNIEPERIFSVRPL